MKRKLKRQKKSLPKAKRSVQKSRPSSSMQDSPVMRLLVDGVLHKMSQPVMGIHGFAQFLKSETDPQLPFYKSLSAIEEQSTILIRTLENIKELIRHRQIKIASVSADLPLKKAVALCEDIFKKRAIDCTVTVGKDVRSIHVDSVHLEKIFLNILLNFIYLCGSKSRLSVAIENDNSGGVKINFISPFKKSFKSDVNFILDGPKVAGLRLYAGGIKSYKGKVAFAVVEPSSVQMTLSLPVS